MFCYSNVKTRKMDEDENKTWTSQEEITLINLWKSYPQLWNLRNKGYRDKARKHATIKTIAAQLETTENEVIRKFHNLRTQFHQELRRLNARRVLGGGNSRYRNPWKFFEHMKFIKDSSYPKTVDNLVEPKKECDLDEIEETDEAYIKPEFVEMDGSQLNTEEKILVDHVQVNLPQPESDRVADEFQIFGDFVTSELRNLQSRENQNKLKRMIQRAILEISEIDDHHGTN